MHNYTVQNRFTTKTKLGNWYEQEQLKNYQFKEYLYLKNNGKNLCLNNQSKIAFSNQKTELSKNNDGFLHFGDKVMLYNLWTEAVLAFNINENILGEETFAVTTSNNKVAVLRNTFQVEPALQCESDIVKYGDKVRFVAIVGDKKLYLQSIIVSPMRSSKFSRQQEVSMTAQINSNSIWIFEQSNPQYRFDCLGEDIKLNDNLLIKHNLTSQWLASQKVNYVNEFGKQFQTFGKSFLENNKTQNLYAQKVGHKTIENPLKGQGIQNSWKIIKG